MRRRIRKFADKEHTHNQTDSSNTEATLILCGSSGERANSSNTEATLILCVSSGEQANNIGDTNIKEEDEKKN